MMFVESQDYFILTRTVFEAKNNERTSFERNYYRAPAQRDED